MNFNNVEFWVQIFNVPLCCGTRDTSLFLGNQLGRVIELDEGELRGKEEHFIRLRVELDIRRPFKRCLKVDLSGTVEIRLLPLKYERLPDFCYKCGRLGHTEREYMAPATISANVNKPYGPWLRASSPQRRQGNRFRKEEGRIEEKQNTPESMEPDKGERSVSRKQLLMTRPGKQTTGDQLEDGGTSKERGDRFENQGITNVAKSDPVESAEQGELTNGVGMQSFQKPVKTANLQAADSLDDSSNEARGLHELGREKLDQVKEKGLSSPILEIEMSEGSWHINETNSTGEQKRIVKVEEMPEKSQGKQEEGQPNKRDQEMTLTIGPSFKSKWKRVARKAHMMVDGPQDGKVGEKRGSMEKQSSYMGGSKNQKRGRLETQEANVEATGREITSARRTQ